MPKVKSGTLSLKSNDGAAPGVSSAPATVTVKGTPQYIPGPAGPPGPKGDPGAAIGDEAALAQTDWYIDASSGDDENDGATAETALRTHAELEHRLVLGQVYPPVDPDSYGARVVRVHLLTDLPPEDPINVRCTLGPDVVFLYIGGVKQVLRSGTLTSITAKNTGTNVPWSITDSGADLSSYVGKRVRITSGARINTMAWVAKSVGGGSVRISNPVVPMALDEQTLIDNDYQNIGWGLVGVVENTTQLSVGDAYAVESLRQANLGVVNVNTSGSTQWFAPTVYFENIDFDIDAFKICELHIENGWLHFAGCRITPLLYARGGEMKFVDCHLQLGLYSLEYYTSVWAGLVAQTTSTFGSIGLQGLGGQLSLFKDAMLQGVGIRGDNIFINRACVFDSVANGNNQHGAGVYAGGLNSGAGGRGCIRMTTTHLDNDGDSMRLWGAGNGGGGVEVFADSSFIYEAGAALTITGTGGDFLLAGATTARSWTEGSGTYTSASATTWANLSSTFSNNAHNVAKNAHIIGL